MVIFVANGFHEIHENWAPTKYIDFTVFVSYLKYYELWIEFVLIQSIHRHWKRWPGNVVVCVVTS